MKVLMICLGNICRSPIAEGVLREFASRAGLDHEIEVDSAGFVRAHLGQAPDSRAIAVAKRHGIDISSLRQRLFTPTDFDAFDIIFVMDDGNYRSVQSYARNNQDMRKVKYLSNELYPNENRTIPDPYYGDKDDFEYAYCFIEEACAAFINNLKK